MCFNLSNYYPLGLYSGIFFMYIKCQSNKSRKTTIVFYALYLLYALSTATVVCDLVIIILQVSKNSISKDDIFLISCAVS